ncbi:MAG TPA: hypothetical protein VKV19_19540 [Ktedonobacteraceae bacterium]|nr:hypothetical protein [Ktedonobacteraceae bacterium]
MSTHAYGSRTPLPHVPRTMRKHLVCRRGSKRRCNSTTFPLIASSVKRSPILSFVLSCVNRPLSAFHVMFVPVCVRGISHLITQTQLFFSHITPSPWRLQPG